jgi:hypothetical protein
MNVMVALIAFALSFAHPKILRVAMLVTPVILSEAGAYATAQSKDHEGACVAYAASRRSHETTLLLPASARRTSVRARLLVVPQIAGNVRPSGPAVICINASG